MSKIPFNIFLLTLILALFSAQNAQTYIPDSLLRQINTPEISVKIDGYVSIIKFYNKIMPQKALTYGENALQIAREHQYPKGEADILYALGSTYHNLSNYQKAQNSYQTAYEIRKRLNDREGMGESLNGMALVDMVIGSYDKSLYFLYQAIDLLENGKNKKALGEAYNLLGIINYILKDIPKAEEISLKALEITEKLPDQLVHAFSHENLGIIYIKKNEFEKALYHINEVLKIREPNNDRVGLAGAYDNLGITYKNMNQYSTALIYYSKSLALKQELNDQQGIGSSYSGMGTIYIKMGQKEKGLEYLLRSYKIRKDIGDKRGVVSSLNKVADTYTGMGDYKNALEYYKLAVAYNDSLLNEQKNKSIAELQAEFQNQKKEQEILLLQQENTIQKNLRNYLLIISLLVSAIAISVFIAYRSKRKVNVMLNMYNTEVTQQKEELQRLNEELKKLNADKDRFFTIIAHDLKSPFTSLLGYSEFLAKDINNLSNEEIRSFSEEIFNSASKVFNLLENLLWWARLNTGRLEQDSGYFDLKDVTEEVLLLYKENACKKNIHFECEFSDQSVAFGDVNMIHTVVRNLVSNAIKFTYPDGWIRIKIKDGGDTLQFSIEDTGPGMEEIYLENLFKENNVQSLKGTVKEGGTGLGLFLCREFIEINNGLIWADSKLNSGSTFYFTLPSEKAATQL